MKRSPDVFDVWFDSAVASWATLRFPSQEKDFEEWWPADFITEGHDQTRGWFYSQLGAAMVSFGRAPYKSVLMHGFTLDDQALLARLARHTAAHKGVPVLISNHDIELTRELYRGARLDEILVKRTISRNGGSRNKVAELLALYPPGIAPEQGHYPGEAELVSVG